MTKRILAVLVALVLVLGCMPVSNASEAVQTTGGTTYYVSSLHGAVGNDGTGVETPFASLLEINEITLQPGDRVLLERGSVFVNEYLHVKGSGSAEAPIIIDVYGDDSLPKPLIQTNGHGVWYQDYGKSLDNVNHQNKGNVSSCILLYDVEYIEISNIAMTNEGNFQPGEVYNSGYRMDRTGVAGVAENIGTVDHIVLRDLDIRSIQGNVYNKHMCNGGIYFVCHKPDSASTGVSRYDDILIEGCRLDEVNRWGIAVGYTAYWDYFPYGPSIPDDICSTYGSTNVVIRSNYLTNIGGDGITTMYCYKPLVEYNVLSDYCQDMVESVYVHGGSRGGMIAAGIWAWMCKTAVFQYNEAYNAVFNGDGQAWDADWGDNTIYQYNYSCNNAGGAVMFCLDYAYNTIFRYNISQNDLTAALTLFGNPNGEVYNNVFYIKEGVRVNRDGKSNGRNNKIYNNIFYYAGTEPASAVYGNWGAVSADWSNNIYYNYQTVPGDPYAITADPLLVAPGTGPAAAQLTGLVHDLSAFEGYKLRDGSPAINAGIPITDNGGQDFFGNELDLLPDIGVHETGTFECDADRAVIVDLELGESMTLIDATGDYSDVTPIFGDEKIAALKLEAREGTAQYEASETAATTLETGVPYLICNTNTGSALTNVMADAAAWGTRALKLSGNKTVSEANIWTLEADGANYRIRSTDGTYLSITLNASSLNETGDSFTAATQGSADIWSFSNAGGYYLDNLGRQDFLGGWVECGNSGTWKLYGVNSTVLDSITELTFTGLFPGTTTIVVGDTMYLVRVAGKLQEVELKVGENATFTDMTGNYTGTDTSSLDASVATVELTGLMTDVYALGERVSGLTSGEQYILVNNRSGKPVTNLPSSQGSAKGLSLNGTKEDAARPAIWTITAADGGYTVQDLDGKYLTIGADSAALVDTPNTISVSPNGTNWTISQNGAYLNHFGGNASTCAAGWQDGSAAYDAGSQWTIYSVSAYQAENATQITFTGVGGGETHVFIGDIMYNIVVTEPEPVNPFVDVEADDFFYESVLWAVKNGITTGTSATTFSPEGDCQRAAVVTFLWRAAGSPEPTTTEESFEDVDADDFFYKAILWAVENGITNGMDATHFGPYQNCNRAQVVTFLWRANGQPKPTVTDHPFTDVKADFYYNAMLWAVENGITNGMDATHFGPNAICNRAQVVTFLYRAMV